MNNARLVVGAFEVEFARYRKLAEGAAGQVGWEMLRTPLDGETNSIAVVMKHVGGNLRSRWMEPLTSAGEKPGRGRDGEFVDDFADRAAMMAAWDGGGAVLDAALASFSDADLEKRVVIRGEGLTLAAALARSVAHTAYHCGQIVQVARVMAARGGVEWRVLTMVRKGEVGGA